MKKLSLIAAFLFPVFVFAQNDKPSAVFNAGEPLIVARPLEKVVAPLSVTIKLENINKGDSVEVFVASQQSYITDDGAPSKFHHRIYFTPSNVSGEEDFRYGFVRSLGRNKYEIEYTYLEALISQTPLIFHSFDEKEPNRRDILKSGSYPLVLRVTRGKEVFTVEPGNLQIIDQLPQHDDKTVFEFITNNRVSINPHKGIYDDINNSKILLKLNPAAYDVHYILEDDVYKSPRLISAVLDNEQLYDFDRNIISLSELKTAKGVQLRPPYRVPYCVGPDIFTSLRGDLGGYFAKWFIGGKSSEGDILEDNDGSPRKFTVYVLYMAGQQSYVANINFILDHKASPSTGIKNPSADGNKKRIVGVYDTTGKSINVKQTQSVEDIKRNLPKGVSIIKYEDGASEKIMR